MKFLDINGVSILWRRIKETFARKDETVKSISRDDTTFTVTRADGTTFEFTQKDTTYGVATESADGLMSSGDKAKLNDVESGAQENVLESVSVNGTDVQIVGKGVDIIVPTALSSLVDDVGYLTEESDPTVPSWAKQPQKPTYTASEVGALPEDTIIPTKVSDLVDDSGHYTKPSDGIPKDDLSSAVKASLDKADTAIQDVSDIQNLVSQLNTKLNALADSDDTTLDQMSEIVTYIKNNKNLIDGITTSKVSVSDIVDNLTSIATNKPLSAKQGKVLKDLIDNIVIPTNVSAFTNDVEYQTEQDVNSAIAEALDGLVGVEYYVCKDGEYNTTTLAPTINGVIGVIYLVPNPPDTYKTTVGDSIVGQATVGTTIYYDLNNSYTEWIYNDDKFERIGEQVSKNEDVENMLKQLGLIENIGTIDNAKIDDAIVG